MRILGIAATTCVVLFWIAMNGLLVQRVLEYRGLDEYRRGVIDYLGPDVRRERWMSILRRGQRIGQTKFAIERRTGEESPGYNIEFSTRIEVDILGQGGRVAIEGEGVLDARMVPETLAAGIRLGPSQLQIDGRRDGKGFLLALKSGGDVVFQHRLPLQEFLLGDGLAPPLPVAGLRLGETYRVPVFDPIFRERSMAETSVVEETRRSVDGIAVDCFVLETRFRGSLFRSYVTADGELLRQEFPPPLDVVLVREPVPGEKGKR